MACFIVPGIEAIITTIAKKKLNRKWVEKINLKLLNTLLWGGTFLLMIEHVWHGEVVPWPPFLTAMTTASSFGTMLHEMLYVGVPMAVGITLAWAIAVVVTIKISEKTEKSTTQAA